MNKQACSILVLLAGLLVPATFSSGAMPGGPVTVGTVNVIGDGFFQVETDLLDPMGVYFLELNYDGVSPLTINTRTTTEVLDTELGLYDSTGTLVDTNDDIVFPGNLYSELRFEDLPAGQYFLAVGAFNTLFNPGFDVTSNATESGNVVVTVFTDTFPVLENINNIELNYNFNGIVHSDEPSDPVSNPDDPNGFRSISDRALDFRMGIPSDENLDRYIFVGSGGELDLVHLGNRNTVSGGAWEFDEEPDLDGNGIQPNWLPDPDQTGRQTTSFGTNIQLIEDSQVTLLFQISNGGGSFDVVVGLSNGSEIVRTVTGPDWFGPFNGQPNIGIYDGAFGTDFGFMDPLGENTLLITEAIIDIGDFAGLSANAISFENGTSPESGIAVLAANIVGIESKCLVGDVNGDGQVSLADIPVFVEVLSSGGFQCEADIDGSGNVSLADIPLFVTLLAGG